MATVTHIIRSDYDPADREKLELETGQRTDTSDPWQTESSFSAQRRIRIPTFVSGSLSYDEWGIPITPSSPPPQTAVAQDQSSTAAWYRSLIAAASYDPPASVSTHPCDGATSAPTAHREAITKNNWFISKALHSAPRTAPCSPAPSLADLLARDPPPLPSERRYTPPVWLHIGPSNKGFGMLQRSGWREGEGLGAHVMRSKSVEGSPAKTEADVDHVQDSCEVIDLTASDSEASDDDILDVSEGTQELVQAQESHVQKSLLTPLPTVLKADRLGIGLKAKTESPYKQSKKRVTHGAAALAAHIRSAEDMRRTKAAVGRGRRGFAKLHKREEHRRKNMLAYLNE